MQRVIEKADILIEALPYIQRFRGEVVVVKFGGSSMDDPRLVEAILQDVAFMECVGLCPVIVHGGGKAISRAMAEAGLKATFLKGLRVTDEASMEIVERVLNRQVNPSLAQTLESFGCKARGIHGEDIFRAEKLVRVDEETGKTLDWGYVGRITDSDIEPVKAYLQSQIIPVVTPIAMGEGHKLYNTNADDAAAALAEKMQARKLVFLSDVPGLLRDPEDRDSLISTLHLAEMEELIRRGVIGGGMLPKIGGAVQALKAGVRKTHIIDAGLPHSLLLELFTDKGVGTEIVQ